MKWCQSVNVKHRLAVLPKQLCALPQEKEDLDANVNNNRGPKKTLRTLALWTPDYPLHMMSAINCYLTDSFLTDEEHSSARVKSDLMIWRLTNVHIIISLASLVTSNAPLGDLCQYEHHAWLERRLSYHATCSAGPSSRCRS